jgi:hypothetical protein
MSRARRWPLTTTCILFLAAAAAPGFAQTTPAPAPVPASGPTALNFSGVLFGSYNYQLRTTPAPLAGQIDNAFVLDRAYLTFRMPAGDRTSIRITTDVYPTTEATSTAYAIRAKYAYLQYDAPKHANGAAVMGRIGILQNVVIDHIESFWPRYLAQSAVERAGFFASADVGLAGQLTLPNKMGEVYATIMNGPGYTTRERDRFKDFAVRLSVTPLANNKEYPLLQTFTLTGWGYKGATASAFVNGGAGQVGAIGEGLDRSRAGVFIGLKDPRLVLGGEFAQRHEDGETGANTVASSRGLSETTGRVLSAFTVVRPFAFTSASGKSAFGLVARYDRVTPTAATTSVIIGGTAPSTANAYHTVIAGLFVDLSQKAQLALDYQESLASANGLSNAPPAQAKGYYAHFVVNF